MYNSILEKINKELISITRQHFIQGSQRSSMFTYDYEICRIFYVYYSWFEYVLVDARIDIISLLTIAWCESVALSV
ncbi:hypothetical protein LSH36_968g00010 [Paralvinella palmiformis]|uniref:Uncharacterized protein n=1 Tax=Paralvinella palmiformis TaxID=53620 RepID=A0AAD9IX73_9ANNE|nr:hypothetical protein LSH36_968g00010 [Paralvinella palmiformis]